MYIYSLYLMFMSWRLFFASLHVEAECAVEMSEGLEATRGMCLGLDAAIVIYEVYHWCCCEHP